MNIKELISQLTLEEKAGLTSGDTRWTTKAVERLGIESVFMADGPHGLRKCIGVIEQDESYPAVCFPAACLTAASFDKALLREMGKELALQAQAAAVDILLGPGVNIKRSPLCGRNFEYFSEDPHLTGELAAEFVSGVQDGGTGTSLKHFFANNQEHRRMDGSSELDERTAREIYLKAFETVVKKSKPWTVMASYNKINGVYATENKQYLHDILGGEWGFDGVVISDWGATHNRPGAVAAHCDLTMPDEPTDQEIVDAVINGVLNEADLDFVCENLLGLIEKTVKNRKPDTPVRHAEGLALARKIATESIILLENKGVLPLSKHANIAFIGGFAKTPRYQGGGSSHVNSCACECAYDTAIKFADISYAAGYDGDSLEPDSALIAEAVATAAAAHVAVIFAGLPEPLESEGFDRKDMKMPKSHNELILAVCAAQPNTVVVLHNGAPVEMPWSDKPAAIIEAYLGGDACGAAVCDILFGIVNPSGRMPESVPFMLENNPSYPWFGGEDGVTQYNEGVFVGYRYYSKKSIPVRYPFGYGLSYTDFAYSNLRLDKTSIARGGTIKVEVDVKNIGLKHGKEVVLVFVAPVKNEVIRPIRELRAFDKIELNPGEMKTVSFTLTALDFSYWDIKEHDWLMEKAEAFVQICRHADYVELEKSVMCN